MPINSEIIAGKFSGLNGGNFPSETPKPRAFNVTQKQWRLMSSGAFRKHAGERPGAAKAIADEIECSPKTAQSWLDGASTPAGVLDLRCMNRIPAYAALKNEIAEMESSLDPRVQAKLHELYRLTMDLAEGRSLLPKATER